MDSPSTSAVDPDNTDDVEMKHMLSHDDLERGNHSVGQTVSFLSGSRKQDDLIQRLMQQLDERCNVKLLMRVWGPRFEFVVRLMLVATFLDDSLRTTMHFPEHAQQVGEQGCLKWLVSTSPMLVLLIATLALGVGLLSQLLGSLCLLALYQPDIATKALIAWTIAQPVLYAQLSNIEFVSESLSLLGGLLMVRTHLVLENARHGYGARTQLLGRLLLPMAYLYYAGQFLFSALTLDETSNFATYVSSLSMFVANIAILVGLLVGSVLVATGLRSRLVAFLIAIANLGFVCYQHPFFRFIWIEDGEWKIDEDNITMPNVALPKNVGLGDFDAWEIYDLHRYYFFLGLSTSGALMLLAQFGPGEIAIQKDEVLIVPRGQD